MNQNQNGWNYTDERFHFVSLKNDKKIYTYLDLPSMQEITSMIRPYKEHYLSRMLAHCSRIHVGAILPRIKESSGMTEEYLDLLRTFYYKLLKSAETSSVEVGFSPEKAYQDYILRSLPTEESDRLAGHMLVMHEYLCDADRSVNYALHTNGTLMSVVAFDDDKLKPETVDLRPFIEGDRVVWTPSASGNWRILEFVCERDPNASFANVLSYEHSYSMLEQVWGLFSEQLSPFVGTSLRILEYHDISFDAPNRRTWTPDFNAFFESLYGFDPAIYYPVLFRNIGEGTERLCAMFFYCRAKMMQEGYLRAVSDFAKEKGLTPIGSVTEPKLTASPWITGDNILNGAYAPGALLDKAYLYGTNSLKIAAASAYNFDHSRVSCELYRDYYRASKSIFYNDAMNALARGANRLMVHIPLLKAQEHRNMMRNLLVSHWESDFSKYIGRIQTLLAGGKHVADIALLYPIYDLCAKTRLYTSPAAGFEYPQAPASADYMNVINSISTYAGHDLTILHPEVFSKRCRTENGTLHLENDGNRESFSILILPASDVISLESLYKVRDFYDAGGKIIATGVLPSIAYEFDTHEPRVSGKASDKEVRAIIAHIFGKESFDPHILRPFFYNSNDAGGEAYFLPFTTTAADGTASTKNKLLSDAIHSFEIPLDIYIPDMPRLECIGALNSVYPEFEALGLAKNIPGGGMLNHIHKKRGSCDIYYFSNTTTDPFDSDLLLRGRLEPEEWNPYTGNTRALPHTHVEFRGAIYTRIPVTIPPSASVLIISDPEMMHEDTDAPASELTQIEGLC